MADYTGSTGQAGILINRKEEGLYTGSGTAFTTDSDEYAILQPRGGMTTGEVLSITTSSGTFQMSFPSSAFLAQKNEILVPPSATVSFSSNAVYYAVVFKNG